MALDSGPIRFVDFSLISLVLRLLKLLLRLLTAFGDKEVAGFLADEGNGLSAGKGAIELRGFACFEWVVVIELPENFLHALVGGTTEGFDEMLGTCV